MALFFFPGVGVVDDELAEREWSGCFGGGDQTVDGLGVAREGVGGRARPGGGELDGARRTGVWPVEEGPPPVGGLVVVTDQSGVGVGVHALLPGHPRRGCGQVRGSISPAPRVGRGREGDRDVVAQQSDAVGLRGVRGGNERGDVLVRVRHPFGPLVQARSVGMNRRGCVIQDLACCRCPSGFTGLGEHGSTRIQRGGPVCLNAFVSLAIAIPISHGCHCISAWCGIVSKPWDVV